MPDDVQRLVDSTRIRDLMSRYARAVDRFDLEALRAVYHPDAHDDHGGYRGGADGLLEYVAAQTASMRQVMHFLGQCLIEFAGADVAVCETYFMTAHTLGPGQRMYGAGGTGSPVQISMFGRYVDRVECRDGDWKIAERVVVFEATRLYTDEVPPLDPAWAQPSRDRDDPIYRLRAEAGLDPSR
jgi:hypothetical protein